MGGGMGGGMDTNIYIACLWQVVAFAPKVIILLPASGRWSHSLPTFKLMRRLRRRTRVYEAYEVKNKREKLRCLLLRRKKKIIFFIFMM
jgi:hypothetical protein